MLALRCIPLRPRMLTLHPSLIAPRVSIGTRCLSTVSQTRPFAQPADKSEKKTRRKRERFAEPYRTDLDIHPLSCDWETWNSDFLDIGPWWHDLTLMEFYIKRVAKVPGTIRPLAFVPNVPDAGVAFEAAGKYYYVNTAASYLDRFGSEFDSHDEFLAGLIRDPPIKGARHEFPNDTEELYYAVCMEQEGKAAKAAKAAKMLSPA
ncbi:hypothetical protein B0H16DRAFT_1612692 [Mycena metata]|uniref:Uncharacterized protein n=1 Tax=Mycena metata TaxID=1033252 RepID=A0AAD7HBR8_9AGAR|nr:hypothetical protein B0H16DRAFT_1612692 [Mycena metata]